VVALGAAAGGVVVVAELASDELLLVVGEPVDADPLNNELVTPVGVLEVTTGLVTFGLPDTRPVGTRSRLNSDAAGSPVNPRAFKS
jgi:hypothetical protein